LADFVHTTRSKCYQLSNFVAF